MNRSKANQKKGNKITGTKGRENKTCWEALLGITNNEHSSDFWIYKVCGVIRKHVPRFEPVSTTEI